ncbi:MAG: large conductance mechanosensitive channel protein MscL [Gammaproteobacteria bacterium]|nr:large conductance mechanosensitive channel protein MscL [Gammaproteobacteria bacterium]
MLREFKEFAVKGNVVDMGVGVVIGAAITGVVQSMVKDIFTPFVSLFTTRIHTANWFIVIREGKQGGPYDTLLQAQTDAALTVNIGNFFNALVSFLIVAVILFFFIRGINRLKRPSQVIADPVDTKECPFCFNIISRKATRCPYCTSDLKDG